MNIIYAIIGYLFFGSILLVSVMIVVGLLIDLFKRGKSTGDSAMSYYSRLWRGW